MEENGEEESIFIMFLLLTPEIQRGELNSAFICRWNIIIGTYQSRFCCLWEQTNWKKMKDFEIRAKLALTVSIHMRLIQENDSQLIISLLGLILKMRPRRPTLTHSQLLSWQCFRYWPSGDMCLKALVWYLYFHNVFYLVRFWQERTGMQWCIMVSNPREECTGECSALCTSLCSHCLETVSFIYYTT